MPYFEEMGWVPEVVTVDIEYVEGYSIDNLLAKTIPEHIKVHYVTAYKPEKTRRFGLGSLSMRSFFQYKKYVSNLLRKEKFDLVYFSTTAFHVMALGRYWKKKFGVPFVLDMQDPWRNDFYLDKPKNERPPKFVISYNIDKYLEAYTMKAVDGIVSVSQGYVDMLTSRYENLKKDQFEVIPFGYSTIDFEVMEQHVKGCSKVAYKDGEINIVYVGRGGHDMKLSCECLFRALKQMVDAGELQKGKLRFWFVGTSYALDGQGRKTIQPIAEEIGVGDFVTEITDRVPFFETLYLLKNADALFMPGSTDKSYTASKLYQYVLSRKELLVIFYEKSSVVSILKDINLGTVVTFDDQYEITDDMLSSCRGFVASVLQRDNGDVTFDTDKFEQYSARSMTQKQVALFNKVISV